MAYRAETGQLMAVLLFTTTWWAPPVSDEAGSVHSEPVIPVSAWSTPVELRDELLEAERVAQNTVTRIHAGPRFRKIAEWSLARFEEVGLALPPIDIWFHSSSAPCSPFIGVTVLGGERPLVKVCKRPGARMILLHELAHVWTETTLSADVKAAFTESRRAVSWTAEGAWHEQGAEQAAEFIAWTVLEGRTLISHHIAEDDPERLKEGFEQLTGIPVPQWDGNPDTPWIR